jgi:hypothetical protein
MASSDPYQGSPESYAPTEMSGAKIARSGDAFAVTATWSVNWLPFACDVFARRAEASANTGLLEVSKARLSDFEAIYITSFACGLARTDQPTDAPFQSLLRTGSTQNRRIYTRPVSATGLTDDRGAMSSSPAVGHVDAMVKHVVCAGHIAHFSHGLEPSGHLCAHLKSNR